MVQTYMKYIMKKIAQNDLKTLSDQRNKLTQNTTDQTMFEGSLGSGLVNSRASRAKDSLVYRLGPGRPGSLTTVIWSLKNFGEQQQQQQKAKGLETSKLIFIIKTIL